MMPTLFTGAVLAASSLSMWGNASPGKGKESNWLRAPAAKCSLVARLWAEQSRDDGSVEAGKVRPS
jgi:hypothetical protein